jgi:hypothetical protein
MVAAASDVLIGVIVREETSRDGERHDVTCID